MSNFNPWDSLKQGQTSDKKQSQKKDNPLNFGGFDSFDLLERIKKINPKSAVLFILIIYALSGFFVIKPDEEALITRFEKFVRTEKEGLHYKLPLPFEKKYLSSVSITRTLKVGNDSDSKGRHLILTKDENIVDTNFEIQWKIKDLRDYTFNIKNPDLNLMQVCESVLRENLGQFNLSEILTNKRQEIELLNKEHIQRILDEYKAGIEILSVQMLRVDPPNQVIDAFRDVQTARVDRESEINKAMVYYNTIIPEARGNAKEIVTQAESLAFEKINKAKGEAIMFDKIYSQYRSAPAVTRARMYIEKMEEVFKRSDITIVDSNLKNVFLNTNKLAENKLDGKSKDNNSLSRQSTQEQEIVIKQQNNDTSSVED